MANRAGLAITKRYQKLVKILHEITTIQNPDLLLSRTAEHARRIADSEGALIFLPDPSNSKLTVEASCFNCDINFGGLSLPIDHSLEGWVYKNKQPVSMNQPDLDELGRGHPIEIPNLPMKSLLIVPIAYGHKKVGLLEVVNRQGDDFTTFDEELLTSLAQHLTICIDKCSQTIHTDMIPELVHELRTPLASLNTALHLLQRTDLPDDRRSHISKLVQTEFNRLSELTSSYLDYSRLHSGKEIFEFTKFDLRQPIIDSVDMVRIQVENKGFNINLDLPPEPLELTADLNKVKQVIINLLNNAIKYNQSNGEIAILASSIPGYAAIRIQDTGIGIPAEHLPHLFERFYRVPHSENQVMGSGLGLAICKQIMEGHGGKIEVSSTPGQGSIFTVLFPFSVEQSLLGPN